MPQFFFAVGFAFRLTYLKRLKTLGVWPATRAAIVRNLGLILLGFVIYHLDGEVKSWEQLQKLGPSGFLAQAFKREVFQTLVHIALASLWILPVIAAGTITRVAFLVASAALHLGLSYAFYFDHAWTLPVIDGGPLGFLTWAIPTLVGSLAYDAVADRTEDSSPVPKLLAWSVVLMGLGYALSCLGGSIAPPPFVQPGEPSVTIWTMSQRTGSVSYLTFAAGFSLAVYALFVQPLRPRQPAGRDVPHLRPERAGRLHRPSHGRRRRQALPPRRLTALVRDVGVLALFRDLLPVHPLPGEERDLPEAVGWV